MVPSWPRRSWPSTAVTSFPGSGTAWVKLADRGFPPVEVTLARLALGAAVLLPVVPGPAGRGAALGAGVGAHRRAGAVRQRDPIPAVRGVLVLGETVTVAALAGIALVLAGVALTCRREKTAVGEQAQ
jgi:hypothetical protein